MSGGLLSYKKGFIFIDGSYSSTTPFAAVTVGSTVGFMKDYLYLSDLILKFLTFLPISQYEPCKIKDGVGLPARRLECFSTAGPLVHGSSARIGVNDIQIVKCFVH